ncbi:MAG: hypothetical protein WC322_03055 [Candidatus Paceibacterota bacterium]
MQMDIKFKSGQPIMFIATRTFTMGANNIQFRNGQEVEFDGATVTTEGESFPMPQLRGPVKAGWLTPAEGYDPEEPREADHANIQVRHPTKGGNPLAPPDKKVIVTVESDERQVGNTREAAAATADRNKNYHRSAGKVKDQHGRVMEVEAQDGTHFRSLKTPAKSAPVLDGDNAGSLIASAKAPTITPVKGRTEDEALALMTEEERATYIAEKESRRSVYDAEIAASAARSGRPVVAMVKKSAPITREGMTITTTTGGGTEIEDPTTGAVQTKTTVVEREGIKFTETNGVRSPEVQPARPVHAAAPVMPTVTIPVETRRLIAKSMCADFPEAYDFSAPAKKRVARLSLDFEDRLDVIRAAFAAESTDVQQLLVAEFPAAFQAG